MPETEHKLRPIAPHTERVESPANTLLEGSTPILEEVKEHATPDAVEYFKLEGWGQLLLEPKLDVYGLKDKVVYIDQFIKDRMAETGLKYDREGYEGILRDVEAVIGVSKKTSQEQRITKIYEVIKSLMRQKMDNAFKERALKSLLIDK